MVLIARHRVVGMRAGSRSHIVASMNVNDPVLLVPEPTNEYDENAIAVFHASTSMLVGEIVSSVKDKLFRGSMCVEDRATFMSRHAGYLAREIASQYELPTDGIVGWVAFLRYAPNEQWFDGNEIIEKQAILPCGFDVASAIEHWRKP